MLEMSGMPLKNNGGANITIRSAKAASNKGVLYGQSIPYKGKEYTLIEQLHSLWEAVAEEYGMVIVNEYHHVAAFFFEKARNVAKVK